MAKLSSSGVLAYSTFLGGTGIDTANAIAVDAGGNAYVAGQTFSADLPVTGAFQTTYGGDYDAFVAKVSPTDSLIFLSYLGGSGADTATAVALDPAANIYISGWTLSTDFPVLNGYQSSNAGNYGAFVTKVTMGSGSAPAAVSVTPSSGNGSSQIFSLQFSDSAGASDLTTVSALINSSTATTNACPVVYTQAANTLMLLTDTGASGATINPGSGSLQNSQCVLNGAGSSVSKSGNILTLNLSITFQTAFAGARNIYLQATNPYGASGWQLEGSWTVPAGGPPSPVSVAPGSGSASTQTFSFVYTDPKGYTALSSVRVLVNSTLSGTSACYFVYYVGSNQLYLENDASSAWAGSVTVGQSGTVQNSQCVVNGASSSTAGSGSNLTLNVAVTFQSAFMGAMNVYMDAYDGTDAGWQQKGTWTLGSVVAMGPVSVTPNSGSGTSQAFSFVYADPKGYTALSSVRVLINSALSGTSACYFVYYVSSNQLYLENDASSQWAGSVTIGQGGTVQNSQCIVNGATSSASGSGSNLTLSVALTFQSGFAGAMNVYLDAYDGVDAGWQQKGTWTLGNVVMGPVSVTPNTGSGSSQTFGFVYADPKGYTALSSVRVLINSALSGTSACYFVYYPGSNQLYLENDASSAWAGSVTVGQSGTVQNSQCVVNGAGSSMVGSGSNLTLNVALTFPSAFAGVKAIYLDAYDGTDAGWQQKGTWTVQ